ncbi:hypothetical protein ACQJBY_032481 [Aegilops geniculata]
MRAPSTQSVALVLWRAAGSAGRSGGSRPWEVSATTLPPPLAHSPINTAAAPIPSPASSLPRHHSRRGFEADNNTRRSMPSRSASSGTPPQWGMAAGEGTRPTTGRRSRSSRLQAAGSL